jgi:hypothetical protein
MPMKAKPVLDKTQIREIKRMPNVLRLYAATFLITAAATLPLRDAFALSYSCDELAGMAARFYTLKLQGYSLEDVTAIIQDGSKGNAEKEALLGDLAIEIYINPDIKSVGNSRDLARQQCTR